MYCTTQIQKALAAQTDKLSHFYTEATLMATFLQSLHTLTAPLCSLRKLSWLSGIMVDLDSLANSTV